VEAASGADARWRVVPDAGDAEAHAALAHDRVWNCFAIADLAPPMREYSRVAVAYEVGGERRAACLLLRHPALTVLSPDGAPSAVAAILARLALPERPLIQARAEHLPAVERRYRFPQGPRELLRMAVSAGAFRPTPPSAPGAAVRRLTVGDLAAMRELYALYPEGHFRAEEVGHAVFFGVWEGDRLLSAGGTHAVAPEYGVAVLGNIFTHPEARGRGHAHTIAGALVADLFARGCRDVTLNVTAENAQAIRVYEALGFRTHARYLTGEAERIG